MSKTPQSAAIVGAGADSHRYDAIVIGSGISGGWAAKELCEKGLSTLVLERGRDVKHVQDYPTAHKENWEMPLRGEMSAEFRRENPILSRCYAISQATEHFFVKDNEHPYQQDKPFDWIRGYQVGGKSLMWARWVQRWNEFDFESNVKNGVGIDWPIRYEDLAPWYSYVEKFAGISGNRDGLAAIPDGEFLPPMEMNAVERHFKSAIESNFPGRHLVISRTANLSQAHLGRGPCLYRARCARGCPYGGYFSSNSATLPAAAATGNLTMRPHSVVHSIIYDPKTERATGVRVVDAETLEMTEYFARIIFVNASTLNTTLILKNSTSDRFPNGLGNDSGALGHYLMDHNYRASLTADVPGMEEDYYFGRRPTGTYLPRFRNIFDDKQDYVGGFSYSVGAQRQVGNVQPGDTPLGAEFKDKMTHVGPWSIYMGGMGEHLPYYDNKVSLSKTRTDAWGMPLLEIDCEYKDNEDRMVKDIHQSGAEMLERAGYTNIQPRNTQQAPGLAIHEMGTARMGRDPKTSVLNGYNQMHAVKNVFVTDGSAMTSSACQNPSLTYMALTARAVDYAVRELNKRNL
ncbi:GMC oxidoreductase [Marinimicrobium sp. ABcell2]|uniref:GMC oxidoreductase n=1 Tax=Marinimicrobium sp. ABcell2 TaxID=3069751 RepID=UPI0027ADE3C4|nr:GMC family oxidoreductase [Marinimicrobium sp. ABcell2]MDQ2077060.1 GMC family oxidoreductase [Marinimicrobium sp. ABcell2]